MRFAIFTYAISLLFSVAANAGDQVPPDNVGSAVTSANSEFILASSVQTSNKIMCTGRIGTPGTKVIVDLTSLTAQLSEQWAEVASYQSLSVSCNRDEQASTLTCVFNAPRGTISYYGGGTNADDVSSVLVLNRNLQSAGVEYANGKLSRDFLLPNVHDPVKMACFDLK